MKKEGAESISLQGSQLDMGNWASPGKFVTLFSIKSPIELRVLDSVLSWQLEYGANRFKFEVRSSIVELFSKYTISQIASL